MSRTLNRSIARKQYAKFAKAWREDLRRAGLYGAARSPKRPTFNQWYAMQGQAYENPPGQRSVDMQASDIDPWAERDSSGEQERGVVTMDIVGRDED